jgi:putative colanic acid biosynthesis acetyltransferase WcaF
MPDPQTSEMAAPTELKGLVDLSVPDNSEFDKGRPFVARLLWHFLGAPLVSSRLLPISALKAHVLRLFGAKVGRGCYFKPGIRVKFPWYLSIGDHCWIGEDAWIDNLCMVTIGSHVCISQGAYLCTGNHDWTTRNMKLFRRPIFLLNGCWVGARATVCPGVTLESNAILSAGAVTARNIPANEIWAGNPASLVRNRLFRDLMLQTENVKESSAADPS